MSTPLASVAPSGFSDENQDHELLPDLNGVDLVMSLSPKSNINHRQNNNSAAANTDLSSVQATAQHNNSLHHHEHSHALLQDHNQQPPHLHYHHLHSTPFSVTDILSPIEESYRKLELAANPPSPYR